MKRIFMALLASAALFVGCTKDNTDKHESGETGLIPVKFTVAELAEATRVNGTAFEVGDEVGMFITKVGEETPYIETVKFTVTAEGALLSEAPVYYPADRSKVSVIAYYPYSEEGTPVVDVNLAANQSQELADADLYRAEQTVTPSNDAVALNFVRALAKVEIYVYEPPFEMSDAEVSFTAAVAGKLDLATAECTYDKSVKVVPCAVADHYEVVLVPQIIENGAKVDVAVGENIYTFTMNRDYYLQAGTSNVIELNFSDEEVIDLSSDGTSNCYIVNKGGATYRFRADIMGNGATTDGITPSKIAPEKTRLMWQAVAAENYGGSKSKYGSDGNMNMLILRQSVELKSRRGIPYVYFTTPETLSPGNAVICVTDAEDNVLWSWHMWVAPGFDAEATAFSPTANANCTGVTMMDRNLGAFDNGMSGKTEDARWNAQAAFGLCYQWGRKDPFHVENVGKWIKYGNVQAADGTITEFKSLISKEKQTATDWKTGVANSIANPTTFYDAVGQSGVDNSYKYFWASKFDSPAKDGWNVLWGNSTYDMTCTAGTKTIYDPCPVGWKVPAPRAFSFFAFHGLDMGGTYHYDKPFRYNFEQSAQGLITVDAANKKVALDPVTAGTFGYSIYINSARAEEEDVREDVTTKFFPAIGVFNQYGNRAADGNLIMMTNSPAGESSNEYRIARIQMNGDIYFSNKGNGGTYDCPSTALPVRCVKE